MRWMLRCDTPNRAVLSDGARITREWTDPLEALHWLSTDARQHDWVGFISYDLGRLFERIPIIAKDDLELPLFLFTAHEKCTGVMGVSPVRKSLGTGLRRAQSSRETPMTRIRSSFTREKYESTVQRVIEYIAAGDVFQVNLSQRFTTPLSAPPFSVYERLRSDYPAAYGALLQYEDFALVCNSPELFLRVTPDLRVTTRPIKGTRPRLPGMEQELRRSLKDQAELNMIIDLERNDLGRVCEVGSIQVAEPRTIEAHPTVYHGVATIEGVLRKDISFVDLLRATFPGGSITGAPKIRAMEIIEDLEPRRRGPYCGAIGYLDSNGTIEFNIAIRTMIAKNGLIHIPVGGGIVADSDPRAEYEETLVKAQAMFAAIGVNSRDAKYEDFPFIEMSKPV